METTTGTTATARSSQGLHRWVTVVALGLIQGAYQLSGIYGQSPAGIAAEFGVSRGQVTALTGCASLFSMLAMLGWGRLLSQRRVKPLLLGGSLAVAACLYLSTFATGLIQYTLLYSLRSLFRWLLVGLPAVKLICGLFERQRGAAFGLLLLVTTAVQQGFVAVMAPRVQELGWRMTTRSAALAFVLLALPAVLLLREPPAAPATEHSPPPARLRDSGAFRLLLLGLVLLYAAEHLTITNQYDVLRAAGIGSADFWTGFSQGFSWVITLALPLFGLLLERWGLRVTVTVVPLGLAASTALLLATRLWPAAATLHWVVLGLASMAAMLLPYLVIPRLFPARPPVTVYSWAIFLRWFGTQAIGVVNNNLRFLETDYSGALLLAALLCGLLAAPVLLAAARGGEEEMGEHQE